MKGEIPAPEEMISRDGGRRYIETEAKVMAKMIKDLNISQKEFVEKYAKRMSDLIRNDEAIAEAVVNGKEDVVDKIIASLLEQDKKEIH